MLPYCQPSILRQFPYIYPELARTYWHVRVRELYVKRGVTCKEERKKSQLNLSMMGSSCGKVIAAAEPLGVRFVYKNEIRLEMQDVRKAKGIKWKFEVGTCVPRTSLLLIRLAYSFFPIRIFFLVVKARATPYTTIAYAILFILLSLQLSLLPWLRRMQVCLPYIGNSTLCLPGLLPA